MLPSYEELTAPRMVTADGICNMRDLGGLPRHDGGTVARGRFYRADNLANLSADGVDALLRLGVRTVIDLRQAEWVHTPPNPLRRHRAVAYHHLDMSGDQYSVAGDVLDVSWRDADEDSRYAALPLFSHLRIYCRWLERRQSQLRAILRLLARPQATPAVYHCEAGKDRTGVISALLLLLAGVPDLAIAADYTHTARNQFRRMLRQRAYRDQPLPVADEADYAARFCPGELMPIFLFWLRSQYRDVTSYLARIGLANAEIGALRQALTASA